MRLMDMLVPAALLILLMAASAQGAPKIYLNPSDQIHNFSPDKTYCEADGMKDVGRKLEAKLKARGFDVQNSDGGTMSEATTAANAWPADIFISLHSNAAGSNNSGKAHGTNTLYFFPRDGREPNPISIQLALLCDEKVVEKMTTYGRGYNFAVTRDFGFLPYNLFVLRKTEMPGTLVEGLFHDNEEDVAVLKTEEGRDAYAQGVYEALCDYFGWSYYPDAPILDPAGPVSNGSEDNLALVVRDEEGHAKVIRQSGVNARWNEEWIDLGGDIDGEPVIARNAQGRLQIFANSGGRVWHKVQASVGVDRWNGWYDLGGSILGDPVVARNADSRLMVFGIGSDGHMLYRMQHSGRSALQWGDWIDLGGQFALFSVSPQADGRLVIVAATSDFKMKWAAQTDGKWSGWHDMDGEYGMRALTRDAEGRLALFVQGSDDHVLVRTQTSPNASTWGAWQDLGGSCGTGLAVGTSIDGRLEVFAGSSDGRMSHNSQGADGNWGDWQALGDTYAAVPAVGRNRDGRIEVFARDKNGKAVYRVQREPGKSGIWDGWYTVGEYFKATVREYKTEPEKAQ